MIFEAPLMKRLHGSGLGTGTSSKQAASISPDEKAMLWSSQHYTYYTLHLLHMKQVETITFNFLALLVYIFNLLV